MRIAVLVEKADGNWAASSDDRALNGNFLGVTASTREEAISQFRESLHAYFDYVKSSGQLVPDITELEVRELLSA